MSQNGQSISLHITEIIEVRPALKEEMNDRIIDKQKFTRLKIKNGEYYVCKLGQGKPYEEIY
ncbi:hypothetical protein LZQ00_01205 [Sphingobacterium sp. SRCM116780]|uniref:hypothetical protein n=1 Tax=Sphingobacterium sp. SRCM116780 TaxID=2907623 RepID=UPI001F20C5AE|nr:hypothetical protein [Sphingobacterium sp. SRCM116780]UIR56450.1 hypothetical protein LZQ00_01205 [Sphingobacterium sp. SRCM116780]